MGLCEHTDSIDFHAVGLTLWAMLLTDLQYALLNAFVIIPYALFMLWRVGSTRARLKLLIAEIVAAGTPFEVR